MDGTKSKYEKMSDIKQEFIDGNFSFPESITVADIPFRLRSSSSHSLLDMVQNQYKGSVIYATSAATLQKLNSDNVNHLGLNQCIVLLWGMTPSKRLVPYDVRTMNIARAEQVVKESDDNFIGSTVEVRITNIPGSAPMKGKVDTGADVCSLHAEEWHINNGTVRFKCPELSQNSITAPLVDHQAVKSADGGVEYRPVIDLNIKVNGKLLQKVMFNLNDRGQMKFPILIGRNALEAGKFKIDPSLDEGQEIDWNYIHEQCKDDNVEDNSTGITIQDLIDFIQQNKE